MLQNLESYKQILEYRQSLITQLEKEDREHMIETLTWCIENIDTTLEMVRNAQLENQGE